MADTSARIWDLPLRLFHWSWAATFAAAWLLEGDRTLYWHLLAGYLFGALLLFRLAWGLAGTTWARFAAFAYGPGRALGYLKAVLRGEAPRYLGHNPAGSWAIYAMLALGAALALTGLLTLGAEEGQGPLAGVAGFAWGELFHELHEALAWLMLGLVGVHLAGVAVESRVHRENLPLTMITGRKRSPRPVREAPPRRATALVMAAAMALFSGYWLQPWLAADGTRPFLPFPGPELAQDPLWQEECGGCHLAYHPSLLPARAWQALLQGQADHFGEDLALDADTLDHLRRYATAHAAETLPTEASWKLLASVPAGATPLRITGTAYWKEKHAELPDALWRSPRVGSRANCDACHLDADRGWFADGAMHPPAPTDRTKGGST